jgi:hypothetical protein
MSTALERALALADKIEHFPLMTPIGRPHIFTVFWIWRGHSWQLSSV